MQSKKKRSAKIQERGSADLNTVIFGGSAVGNHRPSQPCSLTIENGSLVLVTPYDPGLVAALKAAIPATERAWSGGRKAWIIDPKHGKVVSDLVSAYLGEMIFIPQTISQKPRTETRILEVRYIGATKDREDGARSAFGYCNGEWSVIFPEDALQDWFLGCSMPQQEAKQTAKPLTLYSALGIQKGATQDEIKTAFRRMARQWHPDVCKEPNATEMFVLIKKAADTLSDSKMRARYDAGLALEASVPASSRMHSRTLAQMYSNGYRSPLRCGLLIAQGSEKLGRFVISKIERWEDITDSRGRTLVTSWPMDAKTFMEAWV